MKRLTRRPTTRIGWFAGLVMLVVCAAPAALAAGGDDDDDDDEDRGHGCSICEKTALALRAASSNAAREGFYVGVADCLNITDRAEARECLREKRAEFREEHELLGEQFEARLDLCDALDEGRYDPDIDPADFASPLPNPYFPLIPGVTRVYEQETDEGLERVETTVTSETRTILGVECVVVRDVAFLEGEVIEDTDDYYAGDNLGNVWYFGEISKNFEDGFLHDLDGSWIGGEDGARPGILMKAAPVPGELYRQEFLANEAEDVAAVSGLGRSVTVPFGTFTDCLETLDFTPLEPDVFEAKFYAPGIGPVLEVNLESGEVLELIAIL